MQKSDLIEALANDCGLTKGQAGEALDALLNIIAGVVAGGEDVQIKGFGTFGTRDRAASTGRNLHTGETIEVAAMTLPRFTPGSEFRQRVREAHARRAQRVERRRA